MDRVEFMKQLEVLLADISQSEREEALQYYNDYLNDAGVENEQEVLASLGTPEDLAKTIKEGLNGNDTDGEFTETGYKNETYESSVKNEVIKKETKKPMSGSMIVLIVILCILASPLLIGLVTGIFGGGIGILAGIFGIFIGIAAAGIGLFIGGIATIGWGVGTLFVSPLAGVCLIGAGILMIGISLLFIWLTVWVCKAVIPRMIRGIVNIFSRLLHRREEKNA